MGEERMEFAETAALCIYYRGAYEGTAEAIRALKKYLAENGIKATGGFRSIYLEGPPSRGGNSGDYITQVAVPVRMPWNAEDWGTEYKFHEMGKKDIL